MVPLDVIKQVLGVEVGGPALRASFPCAVTSPIQPRPEADVDRLCPTLLRGQVTDEVLQHVPNVGIGAILRRGAPLGRRLGRRFRGLPRRRGRRCRRPYRWHAWWLQQVQRSPHGKLLLLPAAPRVGELLPLALDLPPGRGERPEPRPHVLRHDQAEGISSALPAEACRGRACHDPLEVRRFAPVATQCTKVQGLQVGEADREHRALSAIVQAQCRGVGLQCRHNPAPRPRQAMQRCQRGCRPVAGGLRCRSPGEGRRVTLRRPAHDSCMLSLQDVARGYGPDVLPLDRWRSRDLHEDRRRRRDVLCRAPVCPAHRPQLPEALPEHPVAGWAPGLLPPEPARGTPPLPTPPAAPYRPRPPYGWKARSPPSATAWRFLPTAGGHASAAAASRPARAAGTPSPAWTSPRPLPPPYTVVHVAGAPR